MKKSKINVPSPSQGKPVRVPVIMQMEALECGAACLDMILAYYKRFVPLEQVRSDCGVSRDGSSAKNILKAARNYGFKAKAMLLDVNGLKKKGKFPCIIHWNFNHFVVLDLKISKKRTPVYIWSLNRLRILFRVANQEAFWLLQRNA